VTPLSENASGWLFALIVSGILTVCGLIVPNALRQSRKKRAHNLLKLWNEMLARHQLGYFTFYLAAGSTATVVAGSNRKVFGIPLALTILFYIIGMVRSTNVQDDFMLEDHNCSDDSTCRHRVSTGMAFKLLWVNAVLAAILAAVAYWTLTKIT
jgi:hypothetical protein